MATQLLLAHIAAAEAAVLEAHVPLPLFPPWALGLPVAPGGSDPPVALPVLGVLHALRVSINWRAARAEAHALFEEELVEQYLDTLRICAPDQVSSSEKEALAQQAARTCARRTAQAKATWTWQRDLAGYLSVAWGGAILTAPYFGAPAMLFDVSPWIIYILPHLALTAVFSALGWNSSPRQPPISPAVLDGLLAPFDAITRAGGVFGVLLSVAPETPLLYTLLLAALTGGGGGVLLGTLNLAHPVGWRLSTPGLLDASSLVGWFDVWSAVGSSVIWLATTTQWNGRGDAVDSLLVHPARKVLAAHGTWPAPTARAVVLLFMGVSFAWRAAVLYGMPLTRPNAPTASQTAPKETGESIAGTPDGKGDQIQH